MPYKKNPFVSAAGNEIVDNIFDLMFISDDSQPNEIEQNKLQQQVRYYRENIINIVNNMRKFVDGYQQVPVAESSSSGVHVCPQCGEDAPTIWERWWNYKSKQQIERMVASQGSWLHLLIQMFAFEWAAVYST